MDNLKEFLPYIIIALIAIVIIIYVVFLSKKLNSGARELAEIELEDRRRSIKVSRVSGFIPYQYRAFFEALKAAMPADYIILPNIAVELLFRRVNRKDLKLEGHYVAFGIFTTTFTPVLVIDLKDYSAATDIVFKLSESEKNLIRSMGIYIMEYEIRDTYNIDDLRRAIAKSMNPLYSDK